MPANSSQRWTASAARELNARNPSHWPRYEVVDGELLVTPAPRPVHQFAVQELALRLGTYTKEHCVGHTLTAPADIELEPDSTVGPDVFVIPWTGGVRPRRWGEMTTLLLAVEVLSPSSTVADRLTKRRYYLRNHVSEYWVVDCEARAIEQWRTGDTRATQVADRLEWMPTDAAPFVLDVAQFFRDVTGEA